MISRGSMALLLVTLSVAAVEEPMPTARWDFNEGEGQVAADKIGDFGKITLTGSPEWTRNASGFCLKFSNDSDRVQYGVIPSPPFQDKLSARRGGTIAFWAMPVKGGTVSGCQDGYIAAMQSLYVGVRDGHWRVYYYDGDARSLDRGPLIASDRWTHVAVTWDDVFVRLFVDGKEARPSGGPLLTDGLTPIDPRASCFLGSMDPYFGLTKRFVGYLDDLSYYDHALTSDQIRRDYENGVGRHEVKP